MQEADATRHRRNSEGRTDDWKEGEAREGQAKRGGIFAAKGRSRQNQELMDDGVGNDMVRCQKDRRCGKVVPVIITISQRDELVAAKVAGIGAGGPASWGRMAIDPSAASRRADRFTTEAVLPNSVIGR
jgi:hypothetical protein